MQNFADLTLTIYAPCPNGSEAEVPECAVSVQYQLGYINGPVFSGWDVSDVEIVAMQVGGLTLNHIQAEEFLAGNHAKTIEAIEEQLNGLLKSGDLAA